MGFGLCFSLLGGVDLAGGVMDLEFDSADSFTLLF